MCWLDFGALKIDKNWNLLVLDVSYTAPTTTFTARLTSAEGTSEVARSCSQSFTNYFSIAPRDDMVVLVGAGFNGYGT